MTKLRWYKSDGTEQDEGALLAAGTYYAKAPVGSGDSGAGVTLAPDTAIIGTADLESTDFSAASLYSNSDDYWKPTGLVQRVINAASTATGWEAYAVTASRYRVKLVVTTQGRCPGRATSKRG